MKFSEFLKKRDDERNVLKKEIDILRNEKIAALNKILAKTLKDSSAWYDAERSGNKIKLSMNSDVGDKIYAFRKSMGMDLQTGFSSHYRFHISKDVGAIDCSLTIRYPMPFDPMLKFIFLINGNSSELDVDNIINMSAKYLEDTADEMLKNPDKFEDFNGEKIGEFEMYEDDAEDVD